MQWRSSAVCTAAKLFQIHISESLKHRFQFNNSTVAHFNKKKQKVVILEMERAGDSDRDRDGIWECC